MAVAGCASTDVSELFLKSLRNIAANKSCFDCNAKNPTWSSIPYGVFICIECAAAHRHLGTHISFIKSTQLDRYWTYLNLRKMQIGGNANAALFFRQHNCTTTDIHQKYTSRAAQLYKEKLLLAAEKAESLHKLELELEGVRPDASKALSMSSGTVLHFEPAALVSNSDTDEEKDDIDFFEEHSNNNTGFVSEFKTASKVINHSTVNGSGISTRVANTDATAKTATGTAASKTLGPSVDALLSPTGVQSDKARKPTIGNRKPIAKKSGLGVKKTGLGAHKVKKDFAEIEREAELADQLRMQETKQKAISVEERQQEEEAQLASMRLAYQDLSVRQKKEEEKLKATDPKKAQQVERLGMGFASRSGISHSAISDMKTIEQEMPAEAKAGKKKNSKLSMLDSDVDNYFDDFSFSTSSSSGFSMYKNVSNNSPTERESGQTLESMFLDHYSCSSSTTSTSSRNKANADKSNTGSGWWEPPVRSGSSLSNSSQPTSSDTRNNNTSTSASNSSNMNTSSSLSGLNTTGSTSSEAQKKFGSAKAISSDQYFGDSNDTTWERKSNLSRFEGSTSISSADYFGRPEAYGGAGSSIQAPDLEDVKESVRQGVTKVAGKLSSLANGVMSSISEKYGGY